MLAIFVLTLSHETILTTALIRKILQMKKVFQERESIFFKLFLAYNRQLEFISVKLLALGIISWFSAQIRRDGGSWWAGWASAHPDFVRIEGATRQRGRSAFLLAHPDFQTLCHP